MLGEPPPEEPVTRLRSSRPPAVLLLLLSLLACGAPPLLEPPEQATIPGTMVGRTAHARPGLVTYRLGNVAPMADGLRVNLVVQNGTSHFYRTLMLRVRAHGPKGEQVSVRTPAGGFQPGQHRTVAVRFPPLGFELRDITVELIWTTQ